MSNNKTKKKPNEPKDSYKEEVLQIKNKVTTETKKIKNKFTKELKKIINTFEIFDVRKLELLKKLRLVVVTIFLLSTFSILLVFVNFVYSVFLILISYFLLFIFMFRLLTIKKL